MIDLPVLDVCQLILRGAGDDQPDVAWRRAEAGRGEGCSGAESSASGVLEKSADKARADAQSHAEKLRESANATEANVSATWNDMQETLNAHIAKARQNIGEKKAEIDVS